MDFNFALAHPNGVIKVEVTGASPQAAVASIQMGHEIVAMMNGVVTEQAPVEITPEPIVAGAVDRGAFETPTVVLHPLTEEEVAEAVERMAKEDQPQVDSAGTPFDPELHTGTLKKDGTWRLKKGAASKVEETESEEADEGEPEGNENCSDVGVAKPEPAEGITEDSPSATLAEMSPSEEADITDTELQRYCGRLVQHFGKSDPVFALAAEFVPDDEMPRPTMIKDQAQRRAFIAKAQEQTGVVYHG